MEDNFDLDKWIMEMEVEEQKCDLHESVYFSEFNEGEDE